MDNTRSNDELIAIQFDRTKFETYTQGYDQIRAEIIDAFVEQTPLLLTDLDRALCESLPRKTAQILHKLKSSCAMLCSDGLHSDILELERNAVHVHTAEYLSMGRKVIMKIRYLVHELKQFSTNNCEN